MNPKSDKPLRLFVNPFAVWSDLAFKSGEVVLTRAQAAVARANAPGVKVAVIPAADAPPKAQASKKARPKPARAKARRKAKAKRRAKR